MQFTEILEKLCRENKINKKKLLEDLKLGKNSFVNWKNRGTVPSGDILKSIADYFNVSVDYLIGNMPKNAVPLEDIPFVSIPIIGRVSAGTGCMAESNIIGCQSIPASDVSDGNYVFLKITGDSMFPKMEDGDNVLIHCRPTVESGSYAVVIIDNEDGVVKKVIYDEKHIELISVNPFYPPRIFKDSEMSRVKIFGVVKQIIRNF